MTEHSGSARSDAASISTLAEQARLWALFEIEGEWAEYYPTLRALAEGADGVLVLRFMRVGLGPKIQGDAPEDFVSEAVVRAEVIENVRGSIADSAVDITLLIPNGTYENALRSVDEVQEVLPVEPILIAARRRASGALRPVNGATLWARTQRAAVDTPLMPDPSEDPFASELAKVGSMADLTDALRP